MNRVRKLVAVAKIEILKYSRLNEVSSVPPRWGNDVNAITAAAVQHVRHIPSVRECTAEGYRHS